MQSWQIIAASAAAATITDALLFQPGGFASRPELVALLLAHWPAIVVVWLGVYGVTVVVLTTLGAFLDVGSVTHRRTWLDRVRLYFIRLAITQFFTSMLGLLALGLLRVPVETALFSVLPSPIANSPALAAGGAGIVVGLLGALLLIAAVVRGDTPKIPSGAPGIRAGRLFGEVGEPLPAPAPAKADAMANAAPPQPSTPAQANAVADAVQQQPSAPTLTNAAADDNVELAALIEQAQRPVLDAIRDLATSVNRLRRGLGEIKFLLQDRGAKRSTESDAASSSATEDAATQLRAVVEAVDASVARLGEMALVLSANETPAVTGREAPISAGARSELSAELQALLRDLTPAVNRGDPPR